MRAWILAARPKTLLAAVVPVWAGCDLAFILEREFSLLLAGCTLLSAVCIQIATNYFNDAIDFEKGADSAERLGPERITAAGTMSSRSVMTAACVMLGLACVLAVPLIRARGWPILAIGLPSLFFSYGYTGGPAPLAYRGLGELFVVLFFGLIAVTGTYFVQTGNWSVEALVLGVQIGLLSTVLIAINNLRDIEEDRRSGKRTLAARYGIKFARYEIWVLLFAPHVLSLYWGLARDGELRGAGLLALAALPVALWLVVRVLRIEPGPAYNGFLAVAAAQLLVFAILFSAGLRVAL